MRYERIRYDGALDGAALRRLAATRPPPATSTECPVSVSCPMRGRAGCSADGMCQNTATSLVRDMPLGRYSTIVDRMRSVCAMTERR
ncbi:hypothetical protein JYU34_003170 [Plutella xylostella]|uniref:Uncharacterized protein n=1 Tax=Plutella xylostella TaxID=51655 RepID=A0ABQ7QZD5_PLUXY|nr:hypothetical protein JYU34_003170 [Plutella xylostella]